MSITLFTIGCVLYGFLAPELITAFTKTPVPLPMNVVSGAAAGCLALSHAL